MLRSLLCFGGVAAAIAIASALLVQKAGLFDVRSIVRPVPMVDEGFQRGFRSDAMAQINRVRVPAEAGAVAGDEDLQRFLNDLISTHPDPENIDLKLVFNSIQEEFPGAQYLAANLITSPDRSVLLSKMVGWTAVANPEFDRITTTVFPAGRRLGVLGVMSRRIPAFSLAKVNSEGGRFHNTCPHCDEVHALEIEKESRTLILSCPYCELPFDVLAADTAGRIRRATEFFEGFVLEENPAERKHATDMQRIIGIWRRVADRCEYQLDQEHSHTREVWKTPAETWAEKAGDCEDTSILIADALISAGFEARVAIGWNGNIGQHAWVVVKADGKQYILESTLQDKISEESLTPVADASSFYQPEQLFDRGNLYFTKASPEQFRQDYFSITYWKPVPVDEKDAGPALSIMQRKKFRMGTRTSG